MTKFGFNMSFLIIALGAFITLVGAQNGTNGSSNYVVDLGYAKYSGSLNDSFPK